jgi:hypothetical protein
LIDIGPMTNGLLVVPAPLVTQLQLLKPISLWSRRMHSAFRSGNTCAREHERRDNERLFIGVSSPLALLPVLPPPTTAAVVHLGG